MKTSRLLSCCAILLPLAACHDDPKPGPEPTAEAASDLVCQTPFPIDEMRSLVISAAETPELLEAVTFERVLDQIRATAAATTPTTSRTLFRRWMDTHNDAASALTTARHCDHPQVDPKGFGLACPSADEGSLAASGPEVDPFDPESNAFFFPTALVNRFDLAPADGATCGEHRVVFSTLSGLGRLFFIFEATVPNPHPELGLTGCAPLMGRWYKLSNPGASVAARQALIEEIFFTGANGFAPAVHADHYGALGAGQIRANEFMSGEWRLRQFATKKTCSDGTCNIAIEHRPDASNPDEGFFTGTAPGAASFQSQLVAGLVPGTGLLADSIGTLSFATSSAVNTWDSSAQSDDVDYEQHASTSFRDAITAKLLSLGSPVSTDEVLRRATSQTCGGCHQVSVGEALGGGLGSFPSSLGFVHIDEFGNVSEALVDVFLPHRREVLTQYLEATCGTTVPGGGAGGSGAGGSGAGGSGEGGSGEGGGAVTTVATTSGPTGPTTGPGGGESGEGGGTTGPTGPTSGPGGGDAGEGGGAPGETMICGSGLTTGDTEANACLAEACCEVFEACTEGGANPQPCIDCLNSGEGGALCDSAFSCLVASGCLE